MACHLYTGDAATTSALAVAAAVRASLEHTCEHSAFEAARLLEDCAQGHLHLYTRPGQETLCHTFASSRDSSRSFSGIHKRSAGDD